VPVEAAALPRLPIPPLHLLVNEVLEVLLPDLRLLVLVLVRHDVLLGLLVESDEQLEVFVDFRVFVQLDAADMVRVRHVFEYTPHLVGAVLTFHVIRVALDVSTHFAHEGVPGALQDQADAEVGIVLLLFQAGFDQPSLARHCTDLLLRQLFAHDLQTADLTRQ